MDRIDALALQEDLQTIPTFYTESDYFGVVYEQDGKKWIDVTDAGQNPIISYLTGEVITRLNVVNVSTIYRTERIYCLMFFHEADNGKSPLFAEPAALTDYLQAMTYTVRNVSMHDALPTNDIQINGAGRTGLFAVIREKDFEAFRYGKLDAAIVIRSIATDDDFKKMQDQTNAFSSDGEKYIMVKAAINFWKD